MNLVKEHAWYKRAKSLNGCGNGSASIIGWAIVVVAFERETIVMAFEVVINLGVTCIIGCNTMGRLDAVLELSFQYRRIFIRNFMCITPGMRCERGNPVYTAKRGKRLTGWGADPNDHSALAQQRLLGTLFTTSEAAMGGDPVDVFKNNDFYWNDDFAVDEHSNEPVEPIKHYAMLMYDSRDQNSTVDGSIRQFSRVPHFSSAEPSINDTEDEDEDDVGTREYDAMNFTFRSDAEVGRTLYHDNFDHEPSQAFQDGVS